MKTYTVLTSLRLGYDTTIHDPNPKRYKTFKPGDVLRLHQQAYNGNVWFFDPDGERGRAQRGQVSSLIERGILAATIQAKSIH